MDTKVLGRIGEEVAGKLLTHQGFTIVGTNLAYPLGEIDIIADRSGVRYFMEVKTRSSEQFGRPAEAVGSDKQHRLRRLADYYIVTNRYRGPVAFGVVEVVYRPLERRFRAELIEHAF